MKKFKLFFSISISFLKKIGKKTFNWIKNNKEFALVLLIIFSLWVSIIAFGSKRYADESYHYRQIRMFHAHKLEMGKGLTTIPGYHVLLVAPTFILFDDLSLFKIRLLTFPLALLIIPVFFLLSRKISPAHHLERTLTLALLPVAFVYYPLIYTDIFSALLVLLSFYLSLKKKYHWAALISILSICVRQQNIVWHLFIWTYAYVSLYGFSFSFKNIFSYLRSTIGFFIGIISFAIFVKINGGIAIGDKGHHQLGLYMGNVYFFLALAGILFWPILIKKLFEWKKIFRNNFFWIALISASLISLSLFFYPPELHKYNDSPRFIRNIFLTFVYAGHLKLYTALVFLGTLSLISISFHKLRHYLIYPFTVLCLLPSWLIEQRYTIIPFLFILLFRKEEGPKTERFMQLYFLMLSALLTLLILKTKLFL